MIQREIVYAKTTDSIVKQHLQSSSSSTYLNIQRRMAKTNHLSRCDAFATVNIVSWLGCDAPVHTFFYTSNPLTSRRTFFFLPSKYIAGGIKIQLHLYIYSFWHCSRHFRLFWVLVALLDRYVRTGEWRHQRSPSHKKFTCAKGSDRARWNVLQ